MVKHRRQPATNVEANPASSLIVGLVSTLMIMLIVIVLVANSMGKNRRADGEKKNEPGVYEGFAAETRDRKKRGQKCDRRLRRIRKEFRNGTKRFRNYSTLFVQLEPSFAEH